MAAVPVLRRTLLQDGGTRHTIAAATLRGDLSRQFRGVYAEGDAVTSELVRVLSAVLASGSGAVASGTSAAVVHQVSIVSRPPRPEVTVLGRTGRASRPDLRVRVRSLGDGDIVVVAGIPVTALPRTLVDLLCDADRLTAIWACEDAIRQGKLTPDELDEALARSAGQRRIIRARRRRGLLEPRSESPLETAVRLDLYDGGLPIPHLQREVRTHEGHLVAVLDLAYDDALLGIEADGWGPHSVPNALYHDRRRANVLGALGWHLIRFTWADAVGRPAYIAWTVRETLSRRVGRQL